MTRRPPVWRDGPFDEDAGRRAVALVEEAVREGRRPGSVVGVTGLLVSTPYIADALERGVLERRPMFDRITPDGVAWEDGTVVQADVILWATGFRAEVSHLAPLRLRQPGGGIRMDGTHVAGEPRIHLVGYGPSASTIGANRAGQAAARQLRRLLHPAGERARLTRVRRSCAPRARSAGPAAADPRRPRPRPRRRPSRSSCISSSAMRRPISSVGCRTVVSGGSVTRDSGESSNPTTATSSGTRRPASRSARSAPDRHQVVGREHRVEVGRAREQRAHRLLRRCPR